MKKVPLIDAIAKINAAKNGDTPLAYCVRHKKYNALRGLIEAGKKEVEMKGFANRKRRILKADHKAFDLAQANLDIDALVILEELLK